MKLDRAARTAAITMICIILGLMLAWQYKSLNNNERLALYENKRMDQLKDEIIQLQNKNNSLLARLQELKEANDLMESVGNDEEAFRKELQNRLMQTRVFAGMEPVKGPGLIITIEDGKLFNVRDEDILFVVNELRAADAQAISVSEERVLAMTEIRSVSDSYIMINGRQTVAPYVIKAIGDPEKMEHSLKMIGGVIEEIGAYVNVKVETSNSLIIPAVRDDGTVVKTDMLTRAVD